MQNFEQNPEGLPNQDASALTSVLLTTDQKSKLQNEFDMVESNIRVLNEMLTQLTPNNEQQDDFQLLKDLNATCRCMQDRLVELIGRVDDDLITADILRINDSMNNVFVRYERYMSKCDSQLRHSQKSKNESRVIVNEYKKENVAPLIDFGKDETNLPPISKLTVEEKTDSDFDALAHSRTTDDSVASISNTSVILKPTSAKSKGEKTNEIAEMEEWLQSQAGGSESVLNQPAGAASATSSSTDFDTFLAERAAAAQNLPPTGP